MMPPLRGRINAAQEKGARVLGARLSACNEDCPCSLWLLVGQLAARDVRLQNPGQSGIWGRS